MIDELRARIAELEAAVLAEREACAGLLPDLMPLRHGHDYRDGWVTAVAAYRAAIRGRPAP